MTAFGFDITGRSATIHAVSEVKNDDDKTQTIQYEVTIVDAAGKPVKTFTGDKITLPPGGERLC
ncbi:hypothetical protein FAM09_15100 [Niastella caeni]|uniref:Uncharacterized protein n=1 Tax=Niastella caeni TaxID=2569763 RepID=A0A4S8HSN4_9BACT|nr:hypothetical protein [Niastella caeni]THU38011.1 hypothetical protein FAM09_15100 [Niastella caeni]